MLRGLHLRLPVVPPHTRLRIAFTTRFTVDTLLDPDAVVTFGYCLRLRFYFGPRPGYALRLIYGCRFVGSGYGCHCSPLYDV